MIQIISKNRQLDIKCERNSAKCIHNILMEKYFDYYPKKKNNIGIYSNTYWKNFR